MSTVRTQPQSSSKSFATASGALWLLALSALGLDLFWTKLIGSTEVSAWLGSPFLAFVICVAALRKDFKAMIPLFVVILLAQPLKNWIHGPEAAVTLSSWLIWSLPAYALFWFGGRLLRWLESRRERTKLPRLAPLVMTGLGAGILFYLFSNTVAWAGNALYPQSLAGWWQSQTTGLPQFVIPSWHFLRSTLLAQVVFVPAWFGLAHLVRMTQQGRLGMEKKDSKLAVA